MKIISVFKRFLVHLLTRFSGTWIGTVSEPPRQ